MLAAKLISGVSPSIGSPGGTDTSRDIKTIRKREEIRIASWNVKTMSQQGKIHNTIKEMKRMRIDILGISEMRWPNTGDIYIEEYRVLYSGTTNGRHERGVGFVLNKKTAQCVKAFIPISERITLIQMKASPVDINIIQIYAPTLDREDEEVENMYTTLNKILKELKNHDTTIVMGDFNSKLGEGHTSDVVGPYGLGERNKRGDTLETFAVTNELVVMNTWFKLPPRKLYTWKSPMDKPDRIVRNQIDFMLLNKRFRNSCLSLKTYPGADVGSDHCPLVGVFKVKMKKIENKKTPTYDLQKLKIPTIREAAATMLNENIQPDEENSVDIELTKMQRAVETVKEEMLKPDRTKKKSWMTTEILNLMEERRLNKGNPSEYNRIQCIIRREIRKAKEKELQEKCQEIEHHQNMHDDFNVHKKVREVTGKYQKNKCKALVNEAGEIMIDVERKRETWKTYLENLFDDVREEQQTTEGEGPEILVDEVRAAISEMKPRRAAGLDQIQTEFIKLLNEGKIKWLTRIFNNIYSTGEIPADWLKSEFITIPKKASAKTCGDFRTISLMSHLLKLFLKIIHKRIYRLCEEQIAPNQFGFVNAVGTREALFSVQVLFQRCRDVSCDVFACLIDYQKAFDRVQHDKMVDILKRIGMNPKDLNIIKNLYWNQTAVLRVDGGHTDQIKILRGVRQGCILSPILFNVYSEYIFREALDNIQEGITINGAKLNNIRYADDTIMFADSLQGLQKLMDRVTEISSQYGLEMNINKTKLLVVSKRNITEDNLYINQNRIQRVKQYTYLGTIINENWDNSQEIRCRIETARSVFIKMSSLFKSHNLNLNMKLRLLRCYVFSVLLYGVETWTLNKETTKRLEAFELWLYRRILKISWTQRITNIEVLRRMNKETELLNTVKCRKLQYLGHIMRNPDRYGLLQQTLQGKINSRRAPGRRRISWLANLRTWFDKSSAELFRIAISKVKIAMMIANIRNG